MAQTLVHPTPGDCKLQKSPFRLHYSLNTEWLKLVCMIAVLFGDCWTDHIEAQLWNQAWLSALGINMDYRHAGGPAHLPGTPSQVVATSGVAI